MNSGAWKTKWAALAIAWNRFWFEPADAAPLAAVRILTGLILLYVHLATLSIGLDVIGPAGWLDTAAWKELASGTGTGRWSLWASIENPVAIVAVHGFFVVAIAGMVVGWQSRLCTVVVWLGQLNYIQRGFPLNYGLDCVVSFLTFYLVIGRSGDAFSLDAWLRVRRVGAGGSSRSASSAPPAAVSTNVALRCIQIHMCLVYLCAGLAKLHGASWWSGVATYFAAMNPEMWPADYDVTWIGRHPQLVHTLANLSVWFTLAFEISFAFLIWRNGLRPVMLMSAVFLHLGIGLCMGLAAFGVTMLAGCCAFLSADFCRRAAGGLRSWLVRLFADARPVRQPTALASK